MKYRNDLEWMKELHSFSEKEQKVLMTLSTEKYGWRRKDRIISATGLSEEVVEKALSNLIAKDTVVPSLSKKKNIIFGLKEVVKK